MRQNKVGEVAFDASKQTANKTRGIQKRRESMFLTYVQAFVRKLSQLDSESNRATGLGGLKFRGVYSRRDIGVKADLFSAGGFVRHRPADLFPAGADLFR